MPLRTSFRFIKRVLLVSVFDDWVGSESLREIRIIAVLSKLYTVNRTCLENLSIFFNNAHIHIRLRLLFCLTPKLKPFPVFDPTIALTKS